MYHEEYVAKLTTPQEAVASMWDRSTVVHGMTNAEPPALLTALANRVRGGDLKEIKIFSLLPMRTAAETILSRDLAERVHAFSWFVSDVNRDFVRIGLNDFVPNNFHEIPRLCKESLDIDVTMTTVSPLDKAGFFTFGTVNDYISTAARNCKKLIVEVNKYMPRVFGNSILHISEVDAIVENDVPLVEATPSRPRFEDETVGRVVAELVPNGATIQLGIGSLSYAISRHLENHKDLGIHTEMLSPGLVELIRKGVVNGRKKNLHHMRHVFTFAVGDRDMYDFMNDNPAMESYPVSYTNNPALIAQNDNMVSINATIEVDLLGQCNSEYLRGWQISGTGGQLDFVRGSFDSSGGKSIIALRSTADNGEISRVVPQLEAGTAITIPRMDTHYLATEYGAANLKGKSTHDRALAIIELAHPKFREDLLKQADKMNLLHGATSYF
jgi:itaconate CoA-transferase